MELTTKRLVKDLMHNRRLLDEIYQSGMSRFYNTNMIHDAIDSIIAELRRRGFPL